jgi:hypothetical protein
MRLSEEQIMSTPLTVTTILVDKQQRFTQMVGELINWAYSQGYGLTFGEAYRTPEQAALNAEKGIGISNSLHTKRLAIDLNLFIYGVLQTDSLNYAPLGKYWKTLDPKNAWGGDFSKPDGNHFALSHNGIK